MNTDCSSLHKANTELLTRTKDSANNHMATNTEKLIATVSTHLLRIALEVDKETQQWADR